MNRMRIFLVLALALTVGGVLAFATYTYLQDQPPKVVSMPTKPVVVASADLPVGTELQVDDVQVVQWPAANVPEGAFANPAELQGRGVVMPIVRNEPVLPAKLASKEAGAGLPPAIPAGMRAVSVRVNEVIGVAGYVLPGTRVDVVATGSPNDQRADTTSKVVLTNVQVLATGTKIDQTGDKGKPVQATVVTLLVTPEEAERLTLASTEWKILLALRNPLDQSAPPTPGVKPAVLLGTEKPARAARVATQTSPHVPPPIAQPEPAPTVEMIRGDKRAYEVVK